MPLDRAFYRWLRGHDNDKRPRADLNVALLPLLALVPRVLLDVRLLVDVDFSELAELALAGLNIVLALARSGEPVVGVARGAAAVVDETRNVVVCEAAEESRPWPYSLGHILLAPRLTLIPHNRVVVGLLVGQGLGQGGYVPEPLAGGIYAAHA